MKDGTVLISRGGRQVVTVGGAKAAKLVAQLATADELEAQHLLARVTGHYKH